MEWVPVRFVIANLVSHLKGRDTAARERFDEAYESMLQPRLSAVREVSAPRPTARRVLVVEGDLQEMVRYATKMPEHMAIEPELPRRPHEACPLDILYFQERSKPGGPEAGSGASVRFTFASAGSAVAGVWVSLVLLSPTMQSVTTCAFSDSVGEPYSDMSGTSVASPLAAGALAVLLSRRARVQHGPVRRRHGGGDSRRIRRVALGCYLQPGSDRDRPPPHLACRGGSPVGQRGLARPRSRRALPNRAVAMFEGLGGAVLQNQYGSTETHVVTARTLEEDPWRWPELLVAEWPRTGTGKIDRRALGVEVSAQRRASSPPEGPTERLIAEFLRQVLGLAEVSREDNFFEIGGHSLLAVQLLARIEDQLAVELPLRAIFEHPVLADLARAVDGLLLASAGDESRKLLDEIEALSEEEVFLQLCGRRKVSGALRVGRGSSFGHHGEVLQGLISWKGGPRRALVTMPCYMLRSTATFTPIPSAPLTVASGIRCKAKRAAEITIRLLNAAHIGGVIDVDSNIPWSAGMGSSTADVVAVIRAVSDALDTLLGPTEIAKIAVEAEVASDPVMFGDQAVLFAQREGAILEYLGAPLPPVDLLSINVGAAVSTLDHPLPQYTPIEIETFRPLVGLLRRAVYSQDARLLGRVATASARINQRFLAKPFLDDLVAVNEETGGLGVQVAHSGSVVGLLYELGDERGWTRAARLIRDRFGLSPAEVFPGRRALETVA